jgi:hypothetical protein
VGDQVHALLQLVHLLPDALLVLLEDVQPLQLVAVALAHQFGVAADLRHRHPRHPQHDAHAQPVDVVLGVHASPARSSVDLVGEDAFLLVEPQRVHAQSGAFGDLSDAQPHDPSIGS